MAGDRKEIPSLGAVYAISSDRRFQITAILDDGEAVGGDIIGVKTDERHGYAEFTVSQVTALAEIAASDAADDPPVIVCRKLVVSGSGANFHYPRKPHGNTKAGSAKPSVRPRWSPLRLLMDFIRKR